MLIKTSLQHNNGKKKQRSTTIFQKTNKRKEINTKNTPKQIFNVMLIEDRKINLICPQTKVEKQIQFAMHIN